MRTRVGNHIGELTNLPGCSQIVVSHDVFALKRDSGEGVGANKRRIQYCEALGYDILLCTVDMTNLKQIHILQRNGWEKAFGFISTKTEHRVAMYYRHLNVGDLYND